MSVISRMSQDLGLDPQYLRNIARRNNLYKQYYIPKGKGKRLILQPSRELKVIQYWMCKNVFEDFPISEYCSAYEKGCSIKRNALLHSKNSNILHMDIKDFFPSITRKKLIELFRNNSNIIQEKSLSLNDIEYILDVVLYNGEKLVIGSVASPVISNRIMYNFDKDLSGVLKEDGNYIYTRYADDIVISSSRFIELDIVENIKKIIKEHGFLSNDEKIYFMNRSSKRQVTGVVLDNNSNCVGIGTERYRKIKSSIYKYCVKKEGNIEEIRGNLAFVKSINEKQYLQLKEIYIRYDKDKELFN